MRDRRLKVLHVVPTIFGPNGIVGGAERYAFELARHMAREVDTTLLAFGTEDDERRTDDLRVRTVGGFWACRGQETNPFSFKLFPEILKADVVHCHQKHVVASSAAALLSRLSGKRVAVSDLGGGGWDISAYISTDRWYHAHLHISEYSRKVYGHSSKPWAHVIYGGVDPVKFCPDGQIARRDTVLFVGRLLPHKGVDDLIAALPEGMRLEIIGKPYHADFVTRLHRMAEGKDVLFRHGCDDDDLVDAYRRAACIVLPSVYRTCYGKASGVPELLGQTLLEGMACAAPAICTDVASMPEVVLDGVTGFVVPPNSPQAIGERLEWIANHPAEAARMGNAGRRRVLELFNWPGVVQRCLNLYGA